MSNKVRDDQINIRVSSTLRQELEDAAATDGRGLSGLIRMVLIQWAAQRVTDRASTGAPR
jgi:uncharacterized protein (DUF1778 family)